MYTIDFIFFMSCHYLILGKNKTNIIPLFSQQFYDLLNADGAAKAALQFRALTIFAPTNQAFQRYPSLKANVLYHISKY